LRSWDEPKGVGGSFRSGGRRRESLGQLMGIGSVRGENWPPEDGNNAVGQKPATSEGEVTLKHLQVIGAFRRRVIIQPNKSAPKKIEQDAYSPR